MRNWVSWVLVIGGGVMICLELILGAATGFDLLLLGISVAAGGAAGLITGSAQVGLLASGGMAAVYLLFFRRWVKSKLTAKDQPSNVDALVGRTGVVTERIAVHEAGKVKVEGEIWRAEVAGGGVKETGETVRVEGAEGVTLKVK